MSVEPYALQCARRSTDFNHWLALIRAVEPYFCVREALHQLTNATLSSAYPFKQFLELLDTNTTGEYHPYTFVNIVLSQKPKLIESALRMDLDVVRWAVYQEGIPRPAACPHSLWIVQALAHWRTNPCGNVQYARPRVQRSASIMRTGTVKKLSDYLQFPLEKCEGLVALVAQDFPLVYPESGHTAFQFLISMERLIPTLRSLLEIEMADAVPVPIDINPTML